MGDKTMRWVFLLLAFLVFSWVGPVKAATERNYNLGFGYDLVRSCREAQRVLRGGKFETDNGVVVGLCLGYVTAAESFHKLLTYSDKMEPEFCEPKGVQHPQRIDIFLKWADENPHKLHNTSSALWFDAFRDAFPCPK